MKALSYATALYNALQNKKTEDEKDAQRILVRFLEIVRRRGDGKLLKQISKEFIKIVKQEKRNNEMSLVVADSKSEIKWSHAYDHYEKEGLIPLTAEKRIIIDKTIIGGFQIRNKRILIDRSYRKSLTELYHNVINK